MIPFLFVGAGFDLRVASKALVIGDLFPKNMALRTVGHTVQTFMCLAQFAGRDLPIPL